MDDKIQGFVLQTIRYGDTDLVVKMYTLNNGLQSFMAKGVRGKTSRNKAAFFQPMTFLRFVQSGKPRPNGLPFMRDVEVDYAYQSIPNVMHKSAILMYVAELLSHTLTQQEPNEPLYRFVSQSMTWLDLVGEDYANFPLHFTLELSRFLGFYPQANYGDQALFDMMEGQFVPSPPPHPYYLDEANSRTLSRLLNLNINALGTVRLTGLQRNELIDGILTFMRLHAPVLRELQSHEVLKEVLR